MQCCVLLCRQLVLPQGPASLFLRRYATSNWLAAHDSGIHLAAGASVGRHIRSLTDDCTKGAVITAKAGDAWSARMCCDAMHSRYSSYYCVLCTSIFSTSVDAGCECKSNQSCVARQLFIAKGLMGVPCSYRFSGKS